MGSLLDLPTEVLVGIISLLNRRDILRVMCTNARLREAAVRPLCSDLSMRQLARIRDDLDLEAKASLVKRMTMNMFSMRRVPREVERLRGCRFPQLRSLRKVAVDNGQNFNVQFLKHLEKSKIQHLEVVGWGRSDYEIGKALSKFGALRSLSLLFSENREPTFSRKRRQGWPELRHVTIEWPSRTLPIGLQQTLSQSTKLQKASIHVHNVKDIQWITSFGCLTSLSLGVAFQTVVVADLLTIPQLTELRHLRLHRFRGGHDIVTNAALPHADFWQVIRPLQNLLTLDYDIGHCLEHPDQLMTEFALYMPKLEVLKLVWDTFVPPQTQVRHLPPHPVPSLRKLLVGSAVTLKGQQLGYVQHDNVTDDEHRFQDTATFDMEVWKNDFEESQRQVKLIFPRLRSYCVDSEWHTFR